MLEALGEILREAREARGLTLEDVEKSTRIRVKYLAALEEGTLDALPTPVQARGFLRNYAMYVGLNPAETMVRLEEALNASRRRSILARFRRSRATLNGAAPPADKNGHLPPQARSSTPVFDARAFKRPGAARISRLRRMRRFLTVDVAIVALVFVVIVAFFVWGGTQVAAAVLTQPQITATPQVLGPTATPTLIANVTFTVTPPPPLVNFTDVQLSLIAEQRTFVRVAVDGEPGFQGLLAPGQRLDYAGAQTVEVTTGNAAGLRVILNQSDFGLMGSFGEVVTRIFQPNGWVTPTPSITPTPSETPIPTSLPPLAETEVPAPNG